MRNVYSVIEIKTYRVMNNTYTTIAEVDSKEAADIIALALFQQQEKIEEQLRKEFTEREAKLL